MRQWFRKDLDSLHHDREGKNKIFFKKVIIITGILPVVIVESIKHFLSTLSLVPLKGSFLLNIYWIYNLNCPQRSPRTERFSSKNTYRDFFLSRHYPRELVWADYLIAMNGVTFVCNTVNDYPPLITYKLFCPNSQWFRCTKPIYSSSLKKDEFQSSRIFTGWKVLEKYIIYICTSDKHLLNKFISVYSQCFFFIYVLL